MTDVATVSLTAATSASGEPHTGAMIALLPQLEDAAALAVPGGEPVDQLHCTLLFLGEADLYSDAERAGIVDVCRQVAAESDVTEADAFAVAMFNPAGEEPCVVLGLSGVELANLYDAVTADVDPGVDQHQPWIPHITLMYTDDVAVVGQVRDRCGVVVFDRLRVAFGDQVTDIPLGQALDDGDEPVVVGSVRVPWSGCPRCFEARHDGPCTAAGLPSAARG
jgi:2'-5' RNA ligase